MRSAQGASAPQRRNRRGGSARRPAPSSPRRHAAAERPRGASSSCRCVRVSASPRSGVAAPAGTLAEPLSEWVQDLVLLFGWEELRGDSAAAAAAAPAGREAAASPPPHQPPRPRTRPPPHVVLDGANLCWAYGHALSRRWPGVKVRPWSAGLLLALAHPPWAAAGVRVTAMLPASYAADARLRRVADGCGGDEEEALGSGLVARARLPTARHARRRQRPAGAAEEGEGEGEEEETEEATVGAAAAVLAAAAPSSESALSDSADGAAATAGTTLVPELPPGWWCSTALRAEIAGGRISLVPRREAGDDDAAVLALAVRGGAFVASNDLFREHYGRRPAGRGRGERGGVGGRGGGGWGGPPPDAPFRSRDGVAAWGGTRRLGARFAVAPGLSDETVVAMLRAAHGDGTAPLDAGATSPAPAPPPPAGVAELRAAPWRWAARLPCFFQPSPNDAMLAARAAALRARLGAAGGDGGGGGGGAPRGPPAPVWRRG